MRTFFTLLFGAPLTSAIQIWPSPADIPSSVPARCRSSLVTNITCETLVQPHLAAEGQLLVGDGATSFCSSTCRSSIDSYRQKVATNCGNTFYSLWINGSTQQSAQSMAEGLQWANNLLCIQDQQGYCLPALDAGNRSDCSQCALRYGAMMLSSDYGRARYPEKQFSSQLSSCSAPASSYPWTYTSRPTAAPGGSTTRTTSTSATPSACAGKVYTATGSDTCKSISQANSIAIDRFIEANNLDRNCSTLTAGRRLCLTDPCPLVTIQKGQKCSDITQGRTFNVFELQSWNPILGSMCDTNLRPNLDALIGRSVCIGPPGGEKYVKPTTTPTPTSTWAATMFTGAWRPGTVNSTGVGTVQLTGVFDPNKPGPTITFTHDAARASQLADRRRYCWITDEHLYEGFNIEDYVQGCRSLYTTYCQPDLSKPSPTSPARIPAQCTPTPRF